MPHNNEQWLNLLRSDFLFLDESTQRRVYLSYREFVYRDIYFLFRTHELAQDTAQDTFMKVINKAPETNIDNMRAWVQKLTRNHAYDLFRKNNKYHYVSDLIDVIELQSHISPPLSIEDQVEEQIRNETLHNVLEDLPPSYREALVSYYIEDKSYKEIASKLNTTEQALAQLMVRARKKLFLKFSRKWVDIK